MSKDSFPRGFTMRRKPCHGFTMIRKPCHGFTMIRKPCHGFTMIELLVVITVMVVLISVLLVSFQGIRNTSRDGRRKADLEQIRSALELYRSDNNSYPEAIYPGIGSYLDQSPTDPLDSTNYYYSYDSVAYTYMLCASLEDTSLTTNLCGVGTCRSSICNYKVINP